MELKQPYLVHPLESFSPRISELVVMMSYARMTTLRAVHNLSQEQLDARPNEVTNSTGMLLAHMAAVEVGYGVHTFEARDYEWDSPALQLGERGQRHFSGHDLAFYTDELAAVRAKTLEEFAKRDDDWLYEQTPFWNNQPANNYFKWFHVFEDEINHRGQIRLIKKMLGLGRTSG